jgi:MFS family permease
MRRALRDPAWRRFFGAHAQSCLGSGLAHVALPLLAFDRTGSPWAVTAVLLPDLLPAILFGPILGTLVDRIGWRACAIVADLLRALAFGALVWTASLPAMVAAAGVAGFGTALFSPAALSGLGRLSPSADVRPGALSLFGALDDLGLTAGPALAALLLAGLPAGALLGVNAATFAISAFVLAGIREPAVAGVEEEVSSLWADVRAGLRALAGRPDVRLLLLSSTAAVLCIGVTNVGEVVLARGVLGLGGSGLAVLVAAGGLGTVLGSLAARYRTAWEWRRAYTCGLACMAADLLLCSLAPPLPVLLLVFVLGGFGNGFALVHDRLLLGEAVPSALHGRVFAVQKTMTSLAFAASFLGAGVVMAADGVQHTFLAAGLGMLVVVLATTPRLRLAWPAPSAPGGVVGFPEPTGAGAVVDPGSSPAAAA